MVKLVALFPRPADQKEFETRVVDVHLPLLRQFPELRRLDVTRISGMTVGEQKFHLLMELEFDTQDSLTVAMASPEGKAFARELLQNPGGQPTVFVAESIV